MSATLRELRAASVRTPRRSLLDVPLDAPPRTRAAAGVLGIETVGDLLEHVPVAHDRRVVKPIAALAAGDEAEIEATVVSLAVRPTRRRNFRILEAQVRDATGSVKAVWFNQAFLAKQIKPGMRMRLFGKVRRSALEVREHQAIQHAAAGESADMPAVVAVYSGTEGLKSQRLRELVRTVRGLERHTVEPLPGRLRAAERLLDRASALAEMHFPATPKAAAEARDRLAFEELLLHQLALGLRRRRHAAGRSAPLLESRDTVVGRWRERLPFELTAGQTKAIAEIDKDLAHAAPMQRLLMGEVGSGKTVVALSAMLRAVENGFQAALMAPTETLAEQHFATLDAMLPEVPLALLTGSTTAKRRRETLARLSSGELPLIVGTHALIEPDVEFGSLALAIVDEQHRFGVRQRAALDAKARAGTVPHVLHMTATPIPRTLALAGYGDLDFTLIRELPRGRVPVETRIVGDSQRSQAYEDMREHLRAGRQAYVVCPLVEESDELQARAATSEAERLRSGEFGDFRVGLIHGQMASADKAAAMREFASGETDVLVATSVVEVGIDVPNATVMAIEDAERYGISQLHQLRGRIGRGEHRSLCMLFGAPSSRRLRAVAAERDGFKLAQADLDLRGAGEELGTRQSGLPRFRVAVLPEDTPLLERARRRAGLLLKEDPALSAPDLELLRSAVADRYGDEIDPIPA